MLKTDLRNLRPFASLAVLIVLPMMGCGSVNAPVKEDPAVTAKRVDSAKEMRSYYDKSGGNYDALSPEDKTALDKLSGSSANSKTAFSHMGPTTPTGATPGGLPPSGG